MVYRAYTKAEVRRVKEFLKEFPDDTPIAGAKIRLLAAELERPEKALASFVYRTRQKQQLEAAKKQAGIFFKDSNSTLAEQMNTADKLISQGLQLIHQGYTIQRTLTKDVAELEGWAAATIKVKARLKGAEIDPQTGMVISLKFDDGDN